MDEDRISGDLVAIIGRWDIKRLQSSSSHRFGYWTECDYTRGSLGFLGADSRGLSFERCSCDERVRGDDRRLSEQDLLLKLQREDFGDRRFGFGPLDV